LLNLSAVYLKEKNFTNAKDFAKKVIELDPTNVKAHFRLAKSYRATDDFETALKVLTTASSISNTKDIQKEIAEVKNLLAEQIQRQKKQFGGMFAVKDGNSLGLYDDVKPEPPAKWKCDMCGEEMDPIQKARHIIKKHGEPKKSD